MSTDRPSWAELLKSGAEIPSRAGNLRIEHREIGRLALPSGRVIAADALVEPALPPFARVAPPGHFPVHLAVAHIVNHNDQRIAAAWIAFGDGEIATWEEALLEGRPAARPGDSAYGVDSATGSFLSPEAASVLAQRLDESYAEDVGERLQSNYLPTREWTMLDLPGPGGLNVAVFSAGFGDGAYSSYWGLDQAGRPLILLTDFGLLDPPEELRPRPSGKPWWKFW